MSGPAAPPYSAPVFAGLTREPMNAGRGSSALVSEYVAGR